MIPSSPTFSKKHRNICCACAWSSFQNQQRKKKTVVLCQILCIPLLSGRIIADPAGRNENNSASWHLFGLVKHCTLSFYYLYVYFGTLYFEMPCSIFFFFLWNANRGCCSITKLLFSTMAAVFEFVEVNSRFRGFWWSSIVDTIVLSVGWIYHKGKW